MRYTSRRTLAATIGAAVLLTTGGALTALAATGGRASPRTGPWRVDSLISRTAKTGNTGSSGPSGNTGSTNNAVTIIFGPPPTPVQGPPTGPTETVDPPSPIPLGPGKPTALSSSQSVMLTGNGPGSPQCPFYSAFAYTFGDLNNSCYQGAGLYSTIYGAPLYYLINSTGSQMIFYEYSNGTGWSDCFNHGMTYALAGRDESPGSIRITSNTGQCSDPGGHQCSEFYPLAIVTDDTGPACFQGAGTYSLMPPLGYVSNGTNSRLWMTEYSNLTGWSDCYSTGNVYGIGGTRDGNAKGLELTTANGSC